MMKEKSSAMLGLSLVQINKMCMPKCVNIRDSYVHKNETNCLKNCVGLLHKTHVRGFSRFKEIVEGID